MFDESKHFVRELHDALGQYMLRDIPVYIGPRQRSQPLLEAISRPYAFAVVTAPWRAGGQEVLRVVVDFANMLCPTGECLIAGMLLPNLFEITQEMHPTALMLTKIEKVAAVEVERHGGSSW